MQNTFIIKGSPFYIEELNRHIHEKEKEGYKVINVTPVSGSGWSKYTAEPVIIVTMELINHEQEKSLS